MAFNPAKAVQEAVFRALDAPPVNGLSAVWQNPPEDSQPPLTLIGSISLEPIGGKDGGLDRATFDVVTFVREPDQTVLFELQAAIRDRLDGRPIGFTGAVLQDPVMISADVELMEDGLTYQGTQTFETLVTPA